MKVYVNFDDLDAEDKPSSISNSYRLQVRSINGGSYYNVDLENIDTVKQQAKEEVLEDLKFRLSKYHHKMSNDDLYNYPVSAVTWRDIVDIIEKMKEEINVRSQM